MVAVLVLASLLAGCFDYHERITVHADGTATVDVTIEIDRLAVAASGGPEGLKERIAGLMGPLPEGVSYLSYQTTIGETDATISFELLASSVGALLALSEQLAEEGSLLAGQQVSVELVGTSVVFDRVLGAGLLSSGSSAARGLGLAMSEGHEWVFELQAPGKVGDTNAHEVLPDGSLRWVVPMTEMDGAQLTAEFRTVTLSGLVLIWAAVGFLLLAGMVFWRSRRRPSAPQGPSSPAEVVS